MPKRVRVKPSKPSSLFGMIAGIIFVFIGLFEAISNFGAFGVFWTIIAIIITVYQAYNFFADKGVASWEIDIDNGFNEENNIQSPSVNDDFEIRLRKLARLKDEGLITEEEFQKKREEILREKW
ncbi:SHOCT domain-containing protein [Lutispora thermophila]|uniref:Short C-terminal domain-containing protein n=1 Tax=Lutispora thermophila DSM 19022 TaxID=1122184 RepID=A0A1M6HIC8_9FIRM|nr:SHOCT domain-containing protein [Lutispora thermophila]SHJ21950.1 Short C-terminal domain-containing protein [Lutispora thermophila DSM 19022]